MSDDVSPPAAGLVQIGGEGAAGAGDGAAEDGSAAPTSAAPTDATPTDAAPTDADPEVDPSEPGMVNIRDISIKCGNCDTYQTLASFSRREGWNVYGYECENDVCDADVTRTYVEVPEEVDAFARRDPGWRGGRVHGGGDG